MSYTVTINVLGPHSGNCRPPFVAQTPCQRPGFYMVAAKSDNGTPVEGTCAPSIYSQRSATSSDCPNPIPQCDSETTRARRVTTGDRFDLRRLPAPGRC